MYLDDGTVCRRYFPETKTVSDDVKTDLLKYVFMPNADKFEWIPKQIMFYFGSLLHSVIFQICISGNRISEIEYANKVSKRVPV